MIIKKLAKLVKKTHYLGITSTTNEQSQQWLGGNWGSLRHFRFAVNNV